MALDILMSAIEFWAWFEKQAVRFAALRDMPEEAALNEIQDRLHAYCEHLWFEIGGAPDGPMEFIISAEGNERYFSEVSELANAAPHVPGWNIIPFKPAHGFDFVTTYEGVRLDPKCCWFLPLTSAREPGRVGLRVGVPCYVAGNAETIKSGLYIVADAGLGELVSGQRIAFIEVCELPADPDQDGFIRLSELGEYIAWMSRRTDV